MHVLIHDGSRYDDFSSMEIFLKNLMTAWLSQFPPTGYLRKLIPSHHEKIFGEFLKFKKDDPNATVLNIFSETFNKQNGPSFIMTWKGPHGFPQTIYGRSNRSDNTALFEWYAGHEKISQHASSKKLPFDEETCDWVFCEAVIEHMGSFDRQALLLKELMRVARKGIFVTTPNYWHPIEFYSALPFLHWLPRSWWKRALKLLGKRTWASESMLNLLDAKALEKFVNMLPGKPECSIGHVRLMGVKAYFFLQILKTPSEKQNDRGGTNIYGATSPLPKNEDENKARLHQDLIMPDQ